MHVLVFDAAEHARGEACAHDQRVHRALGRLAEGECLDSALDDLVDMLDGGPNDRPAAAQEARKEIVQVGRRVDCVRVEDVAALGAGVKRFLGKALRLREGITFSATTL